MTADTLRTTAERLVTLCRENRTDEGLDTLYSPDAVSVEAMAAQGQDSAETRGLDGIRAKHGWWYENFEMHSADAEGPFLHGSDRFAVIFSFDATERSSGKREVMKEVAIYTVDGGGRIVREEFYYG